MFVAVYLRDVAHKPLDTFSIESVVAAHQVVYSPRICCLFLAVVFIILGHFGLHVVGCRSHLSSFPFWEYAQRPQKRLKPHTGKILVILLTEPLSLLLG